MVGGGELNFIRSGRRARAIILAVVASAEIDSEIELESFPCQLRRYLCFIDVAMQPTHEPPIAPASRRHLALQFVYERTSHRLS